MLLELLQENSRMSNTQIAKKMRVSETTVRKRIAALEEQGVVKKYNAVINPAKIGLNAIALLMFDVEPVRFYEVAQKLAEFPEVKYLATCTGEHMIQAEAWAKDGETLSHLISERYGRLEGVMKISSSIVLERLK